MAVKEEKIEIFDVRLDFCHRIRKAISGLIDIININFNEEDIYYQLSIDNIEAFYDNLIKLLNFLKGPNEENLIIKLAERIQDSISGLSDIITINFNKKDFFYQISMDNLDSLHYNLKKLIKYSNYI